MKVAFVAVGVVAVAIVFAWVLLSPSVAQLTTGALGELDPSVSPAGDKLAYREIVPETPNTGVLRLLDLESGESRTILSGAEFYGGVSWSPDGTAISYTSWERVQLTSSQVRLSIFRHDIAHGQTIRLVDGREIAAIGEYTSWGPDGRIAFTTDAYLYVTDVNGALPKKLCSLPKVPSAAQVENLSWSPDGSKLAFSLEADGGAGDVSSLAPESNIWVLDASSCTAKALTTSHSDVGATWLNSNSLLFVRAARDSHQYSMHVVSLKSGEVNRISGNAIDFSPSFSRSTGKLYFASADRWTPSGDDLNLFRGFHIWQRQRLIDVGFAKFLRNDSNRGVSTSQ